MNLSAILKQFEPFDGQVLDYLVTWLQGNKQTVLTTVDSTVNGLENQLVTAINTSLGNAGGILKLIASPISSELTALVKAEVAAGETDLGALYDKVVTAISTEAKSLGG